MSEHIKQYIPIQQYKGQVIKIQRDVFQARVVNSSEEEEEVTVPLEKLTPEDLQALEVGSTFKFDILWDIDDKSEIISIIRMDQS